MPEKALYSCLFKPFIVSLSIDKASIHMKTKLPHHPINWLLCLLLLASCAQRPKTYTIGVAQCSEDNWRDKLNAELRTGTYYYDNLSLRFASANDNDNVQIQQINKYIDDGVDLLVVSPNQVHTISSAIERAYDKGIPVILFDRKTDSPKYTAFIGADNYAIGHMMGQYVCKRLQGHGNIIEIQGLQGSSPSIERHRGFTDAIQQYPNIHIIASCHAGWIQQRATQMMDSILTTKRETPLPHIDCIFGQNDRMAMGARQAMLAHHHTNGTLYVGIDALPDKGGGIELVRDGILDASYIYPTRGDLVLQLANNILQGKKYHRDNYLKAAIVTKDNAEQLILQRDEFNQQSYRLRLLHSQVETYFNRYTHQRVYLALFVVILLLSIFITVYVYITMQQKKRLSDAATTAKLQFFTNISHEFRTPLTLILDPINRLLSDTTLTPQQHDLLEMARKNASLMTRLVGEILDFRKIQNGKMKLNISHFDLSKEIHSWYEAFLPLAERKHITLSIETPAKLPINADRNKLERIAYNLLSNAIKYTPEEGQIKLNAQNTHDGIILAVADTGQGLSAEEQLHVFDRFYQASKHSIGGTGIGLAIVKAFAELHGGKAYVVSQPGHGATFSVLLPHNTPCTAPKAIAGTATDTDTDTEIVLNGNTVPRQDLHPIVDRITAPENYTYHNKILLVDDNDDIRAYLINLLSDDYDISEAKDGRQGLNMALKEVPDLIICDVMMPIMDGLEMCRKVKAAIATSHIPVILLTAQTQEDQRAEGYDCGADAYITKPFSGKVLQARVRNLLENRQKLKLVYADKTLCTENIADANERFMAQFHQCVQELMPDTNLNVETLSTKLGLSRVQLYRKIKALTGASPVEMIRVARLKKAHQLLTVTNKSISEVSYDVGFSSPSYFNKCFKDYYGYQPSEVK